MTMALDNQEFKFPDEVQVVADDKKVDFEIEGDAEIEVVDDTPAPDRGREPMREPPSEVTDEELTKYSDSVKQRIQHFSKGYHEERRAKEAALREREEALRLAQNLIEENKKLQGTLGQGQQALLEQAKQTATAEVSAAKQKLKDAHEAFDTDGIVSAQEELARAVNKMERLNAVKAAAPPIQAPQAVVQTPPTLPQPDAKALAWRDANQWFGSNRRMTAVALEVHHELVSDGLDPTSDEYYARVNAEMRKVFPEAFPSAKPSKASNVVAPATRSTAPKKIVLTQTQVTLAKRLGLTPEQYARAVAEQMRKDNG
jgi:hypothetical protein